MNTCRAAQHHRMPRRTLDEMIAAVAIWATTENQQSCVSVSLPAPIFVQF